MKNKILVHISVPEIGEEFDLFVPINKRIGNVLILINKAINELTNGALPISTTNCLFNSFTGEKYLYNSLVIDTNIRNGTKLILLT